MSQPATTRPEGAASASKDPLLQPFTVNLYLAKDGSPTVQELARHIRQALAAPRRMVA